MLAARELALPGRLAGVSLDLQPGGITAICGPNGAGKSTLLACLAGLEAGTVTLDGTALSAMSGADRARAIGFLPQSAEVAWDLSVETLITLGRLPWREGQDADRTAVEAALAALDLAELRYRPLSQLSGGERARALFARVLAGSPRWLLADEPLANLDLSHQIALLARLRDLAGQGLGVVVVLHDLAHAMNHADRVVVLESGCVVADGGPDHALGADMVRQVWGIDATWLGSPGHRALAITA